MKRRLYGIGLALAAVLLLTQAARAAECCDAGGGNSGACSKCGCQLVCDVKEEKKTVWNVKCEKMCTILPGCGPAKKVCAGDDCGESCSVGCDGKTNGCAWLATPHCGRERCIKKLEKKEITVKKPVYKCVACGCECDKAPEAPKAKVEAAPAPQKAPAAPKPPKQAQNLTHLPDLR